MKTHANGCGGATKTADDMRKRDCAPSCDIPEFCRNHYYRGKLLTERDFTDEQRVVADRARLHNLALHGWGVVCGLAVRPHPHCPSLRLVIEPGMAIDSCGREIRVLKEVEILLPKPAGDRKEEDHAGWEKERYDVEQHPEEPHQHDEHCGCHDKPHDLYVCIRYTECETEFGPAPFDDCSCGEDAQQPNRVCESFTIELLREKPPKWDEATESSHCEDDDCRTLFNTTDGCPPHRCIPCLPLAVIRGFEPGSDVVARHIDNQGPRRTLASTAVLDDVVRCILDKLPTRSPTRIETFGWSHGDTYAYHEFMNRFMGTEEEAKGFDITFDSPVDGDPIDGRSFQAVVVFHPREEWEARHMELAPVSIDRGAGKTRRCSLRIDHRYARHCLEGKNFDVYITLRCDVLTGRHGLAVDGNLLATHAAGDVYRVAPPTGDGIPGGDFVSWIAVRSGYTHAD